MVTWPFLLGWINKLPSWLQELGTLRGCVPAWEPSPQLWSLLLPDAGIRLPLEQAKSRSPHTFANFFCPAELYSGLVWPCSIPVLKRSTPFYGNPSHPLDGSVSSFSENFTWYRPSQWKCFILLFTVIGSGRETWPKWKHYNLPCDFCQNHTKQNKTTAIAPHQHILILGLLAVSHWSSKCDSQFPRDPQVLFKESMGSKLFL